MHVKLYILLIFSICLQIIRSNPSSIPKIDDNEFIKLSSTEKYIVVLFTKPDCDECEAIETELLNIQEELSSTLNAVVVKIYNSNLVQIYNPTKEPALVFFRHGVPLLYHGEIHEELILHKFSENKEPTVRELDDNNFEHLTQAATGATTSDWFVMFYSKTCVTSRRLAARWEAVGAALRTRMNVARVNRLETGAATARRFGVTTTPYFILFHHGNMYRYNLQSYDIDSLVHFATIGYKKIARSEPVPLPKTPFDDLTQMIADYIADNNWLIAVGGLSVLLGMIVAVLSRSSQDKGKKDKEKEKEKEKEKKMKKKSKKDQD